MLADTSWVSSQYDHQLFLNTVEGPGGDATVLRLKHPATGVDTGRGLAMTTDGNHRWCAVDPRLGTALTVAESMLNLACVGARPLAVVNCLNFGNPEHPEVMWQLSEAIDGMGEACRALGIPVIGGNVSLYNESRGADIDPTPVIGMLGHGRPARSPPARRRAGRGWSAPAASASPNPSCRGSLWARERGPPHRPAAGARPGAPHRRVRRRAQLVAGGVLGGLHDVSSGGLGLALAEMAVRSGIGFNVGRVADHAELFSESPSRVVACVAARSAGQRRARARRTPACPFARIGVASGDRISVKGLRRPRARRRRRRLARPASRRSSAPAPRRADAATGPCARPAVSCRGIGVSDACDSPAL